MTTDQAIAVREETAITRANPEEVAGALQRILATGDLSKLTNEQRVATYLQQCSTLGLNPISRPFDWLILDNKLVLYPNKSCAEQLRRIHQISVKVTRFEVVGSDGNDPMVVCTVEGRRPNGQTDEATKYVSLMGSRQGQTYRLKGKDLANAYAKVETAAKRRLALSMIGLAAPPDDIENARQVIVDGTGRIVENPTDMDRAAYDDPRLARAIGEPTYEDLDSEDSPLAGHASQAPTVEELEPPRGRPPGPPATFHCDKKQWSARWAMAVKDSRFKDPDDRHAFVRWYTSGWPENRQTDSLGTFLDHATDRQASDLVETAKRIIDEERVAAENDPDGELEGIDGMTAEQATAEAVRQEGYAARPDVDERVHQAAPSEPIVLPARPDPEADYTRPQVLKIWSDWANAMKRLGGVYQMPDVPTLKTPALAHELGLLIIYTEGLAAQSVSNEGAQSSDPDNSELAF